MSADLAAAEAVSSFASISAFSFSHAAAAVSNSASLARSCCCFFFHWGRGSFSGLYVAMCFLAISSCDVDFSALAVTAASCAAVS